jgi:predicted RNA-binding protein
MLIAHSQLKQIAESNNTSQEQIAESNNTSQEQIAESKNTANERIAESSRSASNYRRCHSERLCQKCAPCADKPV